LWNPLKKGVDVRLLCIKGRLHKYLEDLNRLQHVQGITRTETARDRRMLGGNII